MRFYAGPPSISLPVTSAFAVPPDKLTKFASSCWLAKQGAVQRSAPDDPHRGGFTYATPTPAPPGPARARQPTRWPQAPLRQRSALRSSCAFNPRPAAPFSEKCQPPSEALSRAAWGSNGDSEGRVRTLEAFGMSRRGRTIQLTEFSDKAKLSS